MGQTASSRADSLTMGSVAVNANDVNNKRNSNDKTNELFSVDNNLVSLPQYDELICEDDDASFFGPESISPIDSLPHLYDHLHELATMTTSSNPQSYPHKEHHKEKVRPSNQQLSPFESRVSKYISQLQELCLVSMEAKKYHDDKKENSRKLCKSQQQKNQLPLPVPTKICMSTGWELVIYLLKESRNTSTDAYISALNMLKNKLCGSNPMSLADGSYVAPSASASFDSLCDYLATSVFENNDSKNDRSINAQTVAVLAEIALVRGSLSFMLNACSYMLLKSPEEKIPCNTVIEKLSSIKDEPLYGICESSGELYTCGQNSYGELGVGDDIERHKLTLVSLAGWDVQQVVSGNETMAVLTSNGILLTAGLNKSGQCGHGHYDERVMLLRPVDGLRSHYIKSIAASNGCEHMIAVTDQGLAYSWGYNDRGQLGHGNSSTKCHSPKLIESMKDKTVVFSAVSYHHSALIVDTGELYMFGMNDCGQLGLDNNQHQSKPQLVKALDSIKVTMVSCGLYHTLVCSTVGELYSFGKNDYGQLGLGHNKVVKTPCLVPTLGEKISYVACGYYHSTVVSVEGTLLTFGRNDYGQLGIGTKVHQNVPNGVTLSSSSKVVSANCGCYHTVMLTREHQVYSFGRNNKGQLGNRSSSDSLVPTPLQVRPEGNNRKALCIAAGFYTSAVIMERNKENNDDNLKMMEQNFVSILCGRVDIDRSGEIEGLSNFGSVSSIGVALSSGIWFYEVKVITSGLIQIGWVDSYFQGSSDQGEGVGDHIHSWSYDGNRMRRWNSGSSSYGERWKANDIIGCLLDFENSEMRFYRNGVDLGVAYSDLCDINEDYRSALMPGISLERGEVIHVNFGHRPFAFPPSREHIKFSSIYAAISFPSVCVSITNLSSNGPGALIGEASVMIKNDLFVVGGVPLTSDVTDGSPSLRAASTMVWIYHTLDNTWERWSNLPVGLCYHQVVDAGNDQILVIGGESHGPTSRHMDLYRCSTIKNADGTLPTWELNHGTIGAATTLPQARSHHLAAVVSIRLDVLVLVYGGKSSADEVLGDIWYLSLDDFSWSKLPSAFSLEPGPRIGCSFSVSGECVYLFGGKDSTGKLRSDLWRYNTFDRVWQLCHDDCFSSTVVVGQSSSSVKIDPVSSGLAIPPSRMYYSTMADLGNIWIVGGEDTDGKLLGDVWYFSLAREKWKKVEVEFHDNMLGFSHAKCLFGVGHALGLVSPSDYYIHHSSVKSSLKQSIKVYLYGGKSSSLVNETRQICWRKDVAVIMASELSDISGVRTFTSNALHVGRPNQILFSLKDRLYFKQGHHMSNLACSKAYAIAILAHLDRLSCGNSVLEDPDSVQFSSNSYRSLCIDPTTSTFAQLYNMIDTLSIQFLSTPKLNKICVSNDSNAVVDSLYPLLACLKLLKLNFFEVARCGLADEDNGFLSVDRDILSKIKDLLFVICNCIPDILINFTRSSEIFWFSQSIKQETVSSIHVGFEVLFPTLKEQVDMMTKLLKLKHSRMDQTKQDYSVQNLLIPMLEPQFTGTKLLFLLMSKDCFKPTSAGESHSPSSNYDIIFSLDEFTTVLFSFVWNSTISCFRKSLHSKLINDPISELEKIECCFEFKCLVVLQRAALYWASKSSHPLDESWKFAVSMCEKLVKFGIELIADIIDEGLIKKSFLLPFLSSSFIGRFLPMILLCVSSCSSISFSFSIYMKSTWPEIAILQSKLSLLLSQCHDLISKEETMQKTLNNFDDQSTVTKIISLSPSFAKAIGINWETSLSKCDMYTKLWEYLHSKSVKTVKFTTPKIFSIQVPPELAMVIGRNTLLLEYIGDGAFSPKDTVDGSKISFNPSLLVLTPHIIVSRRRKSNSDPHSDTIFPPPAPSKYIRSKQGKLDGNIISWLYDFQKILSWIGCQYAASLILGSPISELELNESRWINSTLFSQGLNTYNESDISSSDCSNESIRNNQVLMQIVENTGPGKQLVERVRMHVDPDSRKSADPKLRTTRLRRQDSVDRTLEKSGGFEAVDHAVRATFAVLLRHSNGSYIAEALKSDGTPTEVVVDSWRSALKLRRWIVREQQKLATSTRNSDENDDNFVIQDIEEKKSRQLELYAQICNPIVDRAKLLLKLDPAPLTKTYEISHVLKMLPGLSTTSASTGRGGKSLSSNDDSTKFTNNTISMKSVEKMEEEDEDVHSDIFAFIQQLQNSETDSVPIENQMYSILKTQHSRSVDRLSGLRIFNKLLRNTTHVPGVRCMILPILASAFRRVLRKSEVRDKENGNDVAFEKVHFLKDLEIAGWKLSNEIREEFFDVAKFLLNTSSNILTSSDGIFCSETSISNYSMKVIKEAVQDMLLVFDVCSIPYNNSDWPHVSMIGLPKFLSSVVGWSSWKKLMSSDASDRRDASRNVVDGSCILPVGCACKFLNYYSGSKVCIDKETNIISRLPCTDVEDATLLIHDGGIVVLENGFNRGKWYWEIILKSNTTTPVFVGIANSYTNTNNIWCNELAGLYLCSDQLISCFSNSNTLLWPCGKTLGVLVDCNKKSIEFCSMNKILHTISFEGKGNFSSLVFPAVGIIDVKVEWRINAVIPAILKAKSKHNKVQVPFTCGGLIPISDVRNTIFLSDTKKPEHIFLSQEDYSTFVTLETKDHASYGTIASDNVFSSGKLYFQLCLLAQNKTGKSLVKIGVVESHFSAWESCISDGELVNLDSIIESDNISSIVGVLYDFDCGSISIFIDGRHPSINYFNVSSCQEWCIAISCLLGGMIVQTNFHPVEQRNIPSTAFHKLLPELSVLPSTTTENRSGESLDMAFVSCDGGEFSSAYGCQNCLDDDDSVFSTVNESNVNIILKHEENTPFCLTHISIRGPGAGYTAPLKNALVFVTSEVPKLEDFIQYNDLTPDDFLSLPCPPDKKKKYQRNSNLPVAYFMLENSCTIVSRCLRSPVVGRYILVKLLSPIAGTNIDVGHLGFSGYFDKSNGPAFSDLLHNYKCTVCRKQPISSVCYISEKDSSIILCCTCYDNNLGPVNDTFSAIYGTNNACSEKIESCICPIRFSWNDKISSKNNDLFDKLSTANSSSIVPHGNLKKDRQSHRIYDEVELFACGQNNYGELCLGHCNSTSKLEHVNFFSGKSIRHFSGGNESLVVVTKEGVVYTCGLNKSGQCGNGTFEERVVLAMPVQALNNIPIRMVAAANGCEHMLAISVDGDVYSWGYNDRGQLGLGTTVSKSHTPKLIESLHEKYAIKTAGVSYHHSAVVSDKGELLTFGMNDYGQLGLDHTQHQHTPRLVESLSNVEIANVSCGLYHTIAVAVNGDVYSFGKNDYGQLGLGHTKSVKIPSLITVEGTGVKFDNVACGYYHTVLMTQQGKLFSFGRNDYGQLGIGSKVHRNSPQAIPLPSTTRIVNTTCGCYHTLILSAHGRVMAFGRNNKGQLGSSSRSLPSAELPLPVPPNQLSNEEVVCIASGFYSTYILTGQYEGIDDECCSSELASSDKGDNIDNSSVAVVTDEIYSSLMKEMDQKLSQTSTNTLSEFPKLSMISRKQQFILKFQTAAWDLFRILMYQSLESGLTTEINKGEQSKMENPVIQFLISSLMENLNAASKTVVNTQTKYLLDLKTDMYFNLSDACIGLLKYCASELLPTSDSSDSHKSNSLYPFQRLYCNQILLILLNCGSVSNGICDMIAAHPTILHHILKGVLSNELPSATISIRLAMLIFPLCSVASVNKVYQSLIPSMKTQEYLSAKDVTSFLLLVIGKSITTWPIMCEHDLGIETIPTSICRQTNCTKSIDIYNSSLIKDKQDAVAQNFYISHSRSAEALNLVRYISLTPTWKTAVNAALARAFESAANVNHLITTITAYYEEIVSESMNIEDSNNSTSTSMNDSVKVCTKSKNSPEVEEPCDSSLSIKKTDTSTKVANNLAPLIASQKVARESLNLLTQLLAAISVIGGHTESFREGGSVIMQDVETNSGKKYGELTSINIGLKGAINGHVKFSGSGVSCLNTRGTVSGENISIFELQPVEKVPVLPVMFDKALDYLTLVAGLIDVSDDMRNLKLKESHNLATSNVLVSGLRCIRDQLKWRSAKAITTVLEQIPCFEITEQNLSLVANVASLITSEKSLLSQEKTNERLKSRSLIKDIDESRYIFSSMNDLNDLYKRWHAVKQRQAMLASIMLLDSTMDTIEDNNRKLAITKLSKDGILSWGIDALQSPTNFMSSCSSTRFANYENTERRKSGKRRYVDNKELASRSNLLVSNTWGILHSLPQSNDFEASIDALATDHEGNSFPLTTSVVRVGRAADSCDIVINDRSVSGRHFHLKRIVEDSGEVFELQDFSKNGTIVDGIRIHGTCTRINTGTRISLILSRGGLMTYEFRAACANNPSSASAVGRPSSILTISTDRELSIGENILPMTPGQQQQVEIGPRSPAQMQNRGDSQPATTATAISNRGDSETGIVEAGNRVSRINSNRLRVITNIGDIDTPTALSSPNPAVISPRVGSQFGTFNLPRTPGLGSPSCEIANDNDNDNIARLTNSSDNLLLSPASFQQRESSQSPHGQSHEPAAEEALRIALGREKLSSDNMKQSKNSRCNTNEPSKLQREIASIDEDSVSAFHLKLGSFSECVQIDWCFEALTECKGDETRAYSFLKTYLRAYQDGTMSLYTHRIAQVLSQIVGRAIYSCFNALVKNQNNVAEAMAELLNHNFCEVEEDRELIVLNVMDESEEESISSNDTEQQKKSDQLRRIQNLCERWVSEGDYSSIAGQLSGIVSGGLDPMLLGNSVIEENPTYALLESSAQCLSPNRYSSPTFRASSPRKHSMIDKVTGKRISNRKSMPFQWRACMDVIDESISLMNWNELEIEEQILCDLLCCEHARKLLCQIMRLTSNDNRSESITSNPMHYFCNRRTLRNIIRFQDFLCPVPDKQFDKFTSTKSIQQIQLRIMNTLPTVVSANSLESNIKVLENLSTLSSIIDHESITVFKNGNFASKIIGKLLNINCSSSVDKSRIEEHTNTLRYNSSDSKFVNALCEDILLETLLHVVSRMQGSYDSSDGWGSSAKDKGLGAFYPKGPLLLSNNLKVIAVSTFERLWGIPLPDPLLSFRHKWRRRSEDSAHCSSIHVENTDPLVTIWRACLPKKIRDIQLNKHEWFSFGDVTKTGKESPSSPVLFVRDEGNGILAPPTGFEFIDISGEGLPQHIEGGEYPGVETEQKQIRSVWWPVPPPGYVAMGCIAGSKENPYDPPALNSVRCIRSDLVFHVRSFGCIWRTKPCSKNVVSDSASAPALFPSKITNTTICDEKPNLKEKLSNSTGVSLWTIQTDFCSTFVPSLSGCDNICIEPSNCFSLALSEEDKTLISPVSVGNILHYINVLITLNSNLAKIDDVSLHILRPELTSALFMLIRKELELWKKMQPEYSIKTSVDLIRALASLVRQGCLWNDREGILYVRSKVMRLYREHEGNITHNALLQALVELLLIVNNQNCKEKIKIFSSLPNEKLSALPYNFEISSNSTAENVNYFSSGNRISLSFPSVDEATDNLLLIRYDMDSISCSEKIALNLDEPDQLISSFRFSNQPVSKIFMTGSKKEIAYIVYYEVTIENMQFQDGKGIGLVLGFGDEKFPLDGVCIGSSGYSFSYSASTGKTRCGNNIPSNVDIWQWNEQMGSSCGRGNTFGCGLRIDTREIFFTMNGVLIGTAFSSIKKIADLSPVVSTDCNCLLYVNLGRNAIENDSTNENSVAAVEYKFQFNAIDWDNLFLGFDWFSQLSEVYGIVKALSLPDRKSKAAQLPDEFMLSADTFLSVVSEDECVTIESCHPYDNSKFEEGFVHIPLATSMRIKLTPECETLSTHCLQIVQGGNEDGTENGCEYEVRSFSGMCGGQEVTIQGNKFTWRFPLQSNFQCRIDRGRVGPYVHLEKRDTRLSLTRDKGWQTGIGVARLDGGVHTWEVKIISVTTSSNIFLGIAKKDVRLDSYLGKDNRGWGWIGNRALWHNGSKQRGTYGEKFKTGDIVRMVLDLKKGTLSYALNGKDLGVAFGPGGTGSKLEGPFYPGFALYNQRDSIELIGGHRIDESAVLSSTEIDNCGDDVYISDDDDIDDIGDIPGHRLEMACELSQLGFPMDWCVFALKHCDDDTAQAADFILSNIGSMEALVREEVEEQSRRLKEREDALISRRNSILAAQGSRNPDENGAIESNVSISDDSRDVVDDKRSDIKSSAVVGTATESNKWGVRFTAIPEFTMTGRNLLAIKHEEKLKKLHESQSKFTLEQDEAIVLLVDEQCEEKAAGSSGSDPLRLSPDDFTPSQDMIQRYPVLSGVSIFELQRRFLILRNLNSRLPLVLPFVNFNAPSGESILSDSLKLLRGLIFRNVKLDWWVGILREQQSPPAARPEIEIDRHKASESKESSDCSSTEKLNNTVFGQCFEQLHSLQPTILRGAERSFKCQFVGEFGDDFGGLYRECLAQMGQELHSKEVPLFRPCPNFVNGIGENREMYIPNVHLRKDLKLVQMVEFVGKLLGMAIRNKNPLDLNLPAVVWKCLVSEKITRSDIESINHGSFQIVDTIQNIKMHCQDACMFDDLIDANFTVVGSDGEIVELVPGGSSVKVTWDDKDEYASSVNRFRLNEFIPVSNDICRGLATIIPIKTTCLFTWREFRTLACGNSVIDIDLLQRRTIYGDGCNANDLHIGFFWDALKTFSNEQKSEFLRFVWGRSRLPAHTADFTQDFKISGMAVATSSPDSYLPIAHTCFFSIDIPAYSSKEIMHEKLLYAITHCRAIDTDNTTVAQRSGQGLIR